ncbi:MAG: HAD family hydrolase [Butyrivibrio sp.]|jgi:acid phosphatase class B|uniref:HAD family hydrolase n=1 Tax=Butyrivibrio sp. TaxID=28121 RepID=UPI0025C4852E|nr:HAD family hydrolase [Butyrivibrio sp.]MBQ6587394.1 HAD family hydrolase [Butyrivibrio sp.]
MKISFDLDEVLFVSPDYMETEPELRFPLNKMFPERLRKGTVYLINELQRRGFEVWVYTSSFRTDVYIKSLFKRYGIHFNDIVNGYRHRAEVQGSKAETLPQKMPTFYRISLHVDDEDAIIENGKRYGFRVLRICEPDEHWTDKVLAEAERIRKLEEG